MSNFTLYISYTYHKMMKFISFLDNVLILRNVNDIINYDRESHMYLFTWQFEKSTFWRIFHHKSKSSSLRKPDKIPLPVIGVTCM